MTRRVLRYEVPVDDQWHLLSVQGEIAKVDARKSATVEFWAVDPVKRHAVTDGTGRLISVRYEDPESEFRTWRGWFRVFGTGHQVSGLYVGTTRDAAYPELIWHLFMREATAEDEPVAFTETTVIERGPTVMRPADFEPPYDQQGS